MSASLFCFLILLAWCLLPLAAWALDKVVPIGHEDEDGFHYGEEISGGFEKPEER